MEETKEITVIIAEDEPVIRHRIVNILKKVPEIEILCEVENGKQLIEQCLIHEPDAVFVDIGLPEMSGMEAVQSLIKDLSNLYIVFITAFSQYAVDAYDISAVDYILKPITEKRIYKSINKIKKYIKEKEIIKKHIALKNTKFDKILIKEEDEEGMLIINQDEIIMLEKEDKYTLIHTENKIYKAKVTMSSLESKLSSSFFQTHRSYIINLSRVYKIIPVGDRVNLIQFKNYEKQAYVSRKNIPELYNRLGLN